MIKVTQEQLNVHNLITKNAPAELMTVDLAELDRLNAERRAKQDAAEKAKQQPEDTWRDELDDLNRRLANQLEVSEAKTYADNQASLHVDAVKAVENDLKYTQELLQTPGLKKCIAVREGRPPNAGDTCDVCLFNRKIEFVTVKLQRTKAAQQRSIIECGNIIRCAKELEPMRQRWEELKKRDRKIANARQHIRGHKDAPFQQETLHSSDRVRKILTWEK